MIEKCYEAHTSHAQTNENDDKWYYSQYYIFTAERRTTVGDFNQIIWIQLNILFVSNSVQHFTIMT